MLQHTPQGELFPEALSQAIKEKFYWVDEDYTGTKRLFFENAGGSFTLKQAEQDYVHMERIGDCPERTSKTADYLNSVIDKGINDVRCMLNAKGGSVITMLTASQVIYEMTRVAAENLPGKNIVTTALEHPSAYDSAKYYAEKTNREFRVAKTNPETGGVDVDEVVGLVDEDTCFLSVIYASNISGSILDIEQIVAKARAKKPDLYIIVDAVQHVPHGLVDLQKTPVDAINFAPYKFCGLRGLGVGWVSDRFASLPHHKLAAKPAGEWELGSPAPAQYAGVSAIVDHVCWIGEQFEKKNMRREAFALGMEKIAQHERALMQHLLEGTPELPGLRHMDGVEVFLDYPDLSTRDFIVACAIKGLECAEAVEKYAEMDVTVYERVASSLYSKRMLDSFGLEGTLRISPFHCHTVEDVDQFLRITAELIKKQK
ncbi:MAG: aminotransferase class V-fold PLP-dependent enzyme [Desulfovibrio sp.]|uniref:aminotransferase class V-fold PLP-dependent enzyme n=1 Tax=Desulfovibrio sp. 7SRBS1 TaxID=3378064 RepID=UPI003B3F8D41